MKCKRFAVFLLSLVLCLSVILQPINGYCNTVTESGSNNLVDWVMDFDELIENDFFIPLSKIYSLPFVVWDYSYNITLGRYITWLQTNHPDLYDFIFGDGEEKAQVTVHGGGGYSRLSDKINNSESIDVPDEVATTLVQYVQYEITQEPLGYVQAYVRSRSNLNVSQFYTYQGYANFVQLLKDNPHSYVFTNTPNGLSQTDSSNTYIVVVDRSKYDVNFIGTVNSGVFSSVNLEHNWTMVDLPQNTDGVDIYMMRNMSGRIGEKSKTFAGAASNAGYNSSYTPYMGNIKNTTGFYLSSSTATNVFTTNEKDELVYVFNTLNSYKNYNSGQPQPYYLTDQGMNTPSWTVTDGVINTGQMSNVGNVYNNIVNNTQNGMTADEVQKLIESILDKFLKDKTGNGSGGATSDGSDFDLGFLGTIGRLIGSLITGIGDLLSGIIGGIVDTVLSLIDMITGENGIISKLTNLFDTNIGGFLTSIFDWLPPEIVTLWSAGIILGVLFGILRIIRG